MRGLAILILGGMVMGCSQRAVMLTDAGEQIQLMPNPRQYPLCLPRGEINSAVLTSSRNSYQEAINQMLNTAAGMGASHITIDSSESSRVVTRIRGRGYYCPNDFAQRPAERLRRTDDLFIMDDPS